MFPTPSWTKDGAISQVLTKCRMPYMHTSDIVILVTTWDRRETVDICLRNMADFKQNAKLVVIDDGSSEYDHHWLLDMGVDYVIRHEKHGEGGSAGVAKLRVEGFDYVLENYPEAEWVYCTDSDVYHDPAWATRLAEITTALPTYSQFSLYNSISQIGRGVTITDDLMNELRLIRRAECPGASMLLRTDVLMAAGSPYEITPEHVARHGAWDHVISTYLSKYRIIISEVSYAEHYGIKGIHGYNAEHSINPTGYLIAREESVLKALNRANFDDI